MPDTAAQSHRIVVGFDGSEGSQRALAWAADEARQRGAELLIVRAWTPGEFGTDEEQDQIAQKRLDDEVRAFFDQGTTPDFTTQAKAGHAAKVLLRYAEDANMLGCRVPGSGRIRWTDPRLRQSPGGDARGSPGSRHRQALTSLEATRIS